MDNREGWVRRAAKQALFALALVGGPSAHAAGWSGGGSQVVPRSEQTATVLPNGSVLIAGGAIGIGILASAEVYDPVAARSLSTGSMAGPRALHTATLLRDGKVLVAGGTSGTAALGSAELYDPVVGTFAATGAMVTPRQAAVATLLIDGRVLIAGGYDASGVLANAELYDPATGQFTATGSLAAGRRRTTSTLLADGRVLIAGGFDSASNHYLASAEIYDPSTAIFTSAANLNTARGLATATLLSSGKVLVAGGSADTGNLRSAELYDPTANAWSLTGPLTTARNTAAAALLPNGTVLIISGAVSTTTFVSSNEIYDPTKGTFTNAGVLANPRSNAAAVIVPGGDVLVAGGNASIFAHGGTTTASIERYDPRVPTFTASGSLQHLHFLNDAVNMPDGRIVVIDSLSEIYTPATGMFAGTIFAATQHAGGETSTALADGRILVVGGVDVVGDTRIADLFLTDFGVFGETATTLAPRYYHTATLLPDGTVLIAGGADQGGEANFLASAEIFDPAANAFHSTGSMLTARDFATATLLPNGKVLIAGGENPEVTPLVSAELYDPVSGTFSATGSLAVARYSATATLLRSGKVLIAGGHLANNSAEIYDPSTGTFAATTGSMIAARTLATATLLANGKVLIAGGRDEATNTTRGDTEIYDPASDTFSLGGNLITPRESHTANVLDDGRVLIAGGYIANPETFISSSEIYDPGIGFAEAQRPLLVSAVLGHASPPASLTLGGESFRGSLRQQAGAAIGSEGGSGGNQSSAANSPLLYIERMDNAQGLFVAPDPSAEWTDTTFATSVLSGLPLGLYRATMFVAGIPSHARVFAFAAPAQLSLNGSESTPVLQPFPVPLTATARDTNGNPIAGATVSFSVSPAGNGATATLSAASAITDMNGVATVIATANAVAGNYNAHASVGNVGSLQILLTNRPGPPATITIAAGSPQSALVHAAFALPLSVHVQDAEGNANINWTINFAVPANGASAVLSATHATADANGNVSVTATAGSVAGTYLVNAMVSTLAPAQFSLTNLRGPAALISAHDGAAFDGTAGEALATPPAVIVTDLDGNPVPDVQVQFATVGATSGNITGDEPISGDDGVATLGSWTLDPTPGINTLTATAAGLGGSPVTFTANSGSQLDVAVTLTTNGKSFVQYGHAVDYVIVVTATGPSNASGVLVTDVLSPLLDPATASWVCVPATASSCDSGGSGAPNGAHADIATGSSVTFVVSANVIGGPSGELITNTASASADGDTNPANNSMQLDVQAVIFRNGFETGGDGAN